MNRVKKIVVPGPGKRQGYNEPIGTKFGKWEVIGYEKVWNTGGSTKDGWWETYLTCRCECGKVQAISKGNLRQGRTVGCRQCDKCHVTHGNYKHNLHSVWQAMKQRCRNKNHEEYENYGARGIDVCDSWYDSFVVFYNWCIDNGWEKGLQLDRRDNNDHYTPENCRFVTQAINLRNRRKKIKATSGFIGVSKVVNHRSTKWRAYVNFAGRLYRLGNFLSAEEAAVVRDGFVKRCAFPLHLNFEDANFNIAIAESNLDIAECLRKADAELLRIKLSRPPELVRLNRPEHYKPQERLSGEILRIEQVKEKI